MSKIETLTLKDYENRDRRIDVYLPNTYSTNKKFKVIYFQDGQNVFYDSDASYGKCWDVKDICDTCNYPFIIVAIWNLEKERLNDYSPFPVTLQKAIATRSQWTKHDGDKYASWLVEVVKPYIDAHYSTLTDFASTGIIGSSMGGVMSSYIGAKYPNVFKFVGVFSLASWYNEEAHLNFIKSSKPNLNQYYCVYVGTDEMSIPNYLEMTKIYLDNTSNYLQVLEGLGFDDEHIAFYLGKGEQHCEASWSKYVNNFFKVINKVGI